MKPPKKKRPPSRSQAPSPAQASPGPLDILRNLARHHAAVWADHEAARAAAHDASESMLIYGHSLAQMLYDAEETRPDPDDQGPAWRPTRGIVIGGVCYYASGGSDELQLHRVPIAWTAD